MAKKKEKSKAKGKKKSPRTTHWPWRTWVFYGDSGIGKTTLAAGAPTPRFLDSNQGLLSVEGRPGYEHVRSSIVSCSRHLELAYDKFTGTHPRIDWRGRHQTIVFDHFDDIQAIVLDELTEEAAKKDDRRRADEPYQKEWGIMGARLKRFIRKFKAVPCHKILICSVGENKMTGQLQPNLSGQLRSQLPYFADYIGYLRMGKKGRRFLYLDPTEDFLAKQRSWWNKQSRYTIPAEDPKFLTKLFASLAAGPKSTQSGGRKESK